MSLFGLQQLPQAHLALANWVKALAPGAFLPFVILQISLPQFDERAQSSAQQSSEVQCSIAQTVHFPMSFTSIVQSSAKSLNLSCINPLVYLDTLTSGRRSM